MFLHRLFINMRNRQARRDLADPYAMHSTLCRAFVPPENPMPPGAALWRLETSAHSTLHPVLLIQTGVLPPDWGYLLAGGWLAREPDPPMDLVERLRLATLRPGTRFRFRLRANPSKMKDGKRLGLMRRPDQEAWLVRVGKERGGFSLPASSVFFSVPEQGETDVMVSEEKMLTGGKRGLPGTAPIRIFSVLYEGFLTVEDPELFRLALSSGLGHGKALGLGLLSIAPMDGAARRDDL